MLTQKAFDNKKNIGKQDQEAPWRRLRYKIGLANLEEWLEKRPLTILDLGGGNAYDAIPLAKIGHQLILISRFYHFISQKNLTKPPN